MVRKDRRDNLFSSIRETPGNVTKKTLFRALAVVIIIIFLSIFSWYELTITEQRHIDNITKHVAEFSADRIQTKLINDIEPSIHLSRAWEHQNGLSYQDWKIDQQHHIQDVHGDLNLVWLSGDYKTAWTLPSHIDKNILIENAKKIKLKLYPYNIYLNKTGGNYYINVYIPLFIHHGKKFNGYLISIYPTKHFFHTITNDGMLKHFAITVSSNKHNIYNINTGHKKLVIKHRQQQTIKLNNIIWQVTVTPDKIYAQLFTSWIPNLGLVVGLLFAFMAGFVLVLLDVTRANAKTIRETAAKYGAVFKSAVNAIVRADEHGIILECNPATTKLLGYTEAELIGQNVSILTPSPHREKHDQYIEHYLETGKSKILGKYRDVQARHKKGHKVAIIISINEIRFREARQFIAIMQDISRLEEAKHELEQLAHHDFLTGLYNRAYFDEQLEKITSKDTKTAFALISLDLDDFKEVNDELGHKVGDELLQKVTHQLQKLADKDDILCRLGGDEFIIISYKYSTPEAAATFVDEIINTLKQPIEIDKHKITIGASIGIAFYPDSAASKTTLLKYADVAMYRAKETGKNHYEIYDPKFQEKGEQRLKIKNNIDDALANDEFYLVYQPQFCLQGRNVVGIEALLRCKNQYFKDLSPEKFFPIMDNSPKLADVTQWVLSQAFTDFKKIKSHQSLILAINLSPKQLLLDNLAKQVDKIGKANDIDFNNIQFELTESALSDNFKNLLEPLEELTSLGCQISIDDYGIGHSSLSRIDTLPINCIKIDKSFIAKLAQKDSYSLAIVENTIELAKKLNLVVIAEGVETEQQAELLLEKGCATAQGFLFSKPLMFSKLVEELAKNK